MMFGLTQEQQAGIRADLTTKNRDVYVDIAARHGTSESTVGQFKRYLESQGIKVEKEGSSKYIATPFQIAPPEKKNSNKKNADSPQHRKMRKIREKIDKRVAKREDDQIERECYDYDFE